MPLALHLMKLIVMAMMSKTWGVSSLRKLAGQRPFQGAEARRKRPPRSTTAEGGKEEKRRSFTQGNFHVEMRKVRLGQKLSLDRRSYRFLRSLLDITYAWPQRDGFHAPFPLFLSSPSLSDTHRIRGHFHMGPSLSPFLSRYFLHKCNLMRAGTDPAQVSTFLETLESSNLRRGG